MTARLQIEVTLERDEDGEVTATLFANNGRGLVKIGTVTLLPDDGMEHRLFKLRIDERVLMNSVN